MPTTANRGIPTPVIQKPMRAYQTFTPEFCPIEAGKIKLPAPKKSANSINPIGIYLVATFLLLMFFPFVFVVVNFHFMELSLIAHKG